MTIRPIDPSSIGVVTTVWIARDPGTSGGSLESAEPSGADLLVVINAATKMRGEKRRRPRSNESPSSVEEHGPQIKPGDIVRYETHWLKEPLVGVVGILDWGWATVAYYSADRENGLDVLTMIDVPAHDLRFVREGTEQELRTGITLIARMHAGDHGKLARQETLRRGWRSLDREDVTDRMWGVEFFVGEQRIGNATEAYHGTGTGTASWKAWHWIMDDCSGFAHALGTWPSLEDARQAVVEAENTRRAKEQADE